MAGLRLYSVIRTASYRWDLGSFWGKRNTSVRKVSFTNELGKSDASELSVSYY